MTQVSTQKKQDQLQIPTMNGYNSTNFKQTPVLDGEQAPQYHHKKVFKFAVETIIIQSLEVMITDNDIESTDSTDCDSP